MTEKLANKLFDRSSGILAYIIKIFQETQAQALLQGQARMDERVMQRDIDILAIKVYKTYSGETYISDFEVSDAETDDAPPAQSPEESLEPVPMFYVNQRGRRATSRDAQDLAAVFAAGNDLLHFLKENDLVEGWPEIC